MPRRSLLALVVTLLVGGCNKPSPAPSAAAPDTGAVDTVAAAGAPLVDSANSVLDSVASENDTVIVLPEGAHDSTVITDTTATN